MSLRMSLLGVNRIIFVGFLTLVADFVAGDGLKMMLTAGNGSDVVADADMVADDVAVARMRMIPRTVASLTNYGVPAINDRAVYAFFPDSTYTVTVTSVKSVYGGALLIEGKGELGSSVRLTSVFSPEGIRHELRDPSNGILYQAVSLDDGSVEVCEFDDSKKLPVWDLPPLLLPGGVAASNESTGAAQAEPPSYATPTEIDFMMVFDTTAQAWANANGGVTAFANAAVSKMNAALSGSGVNCSYRLVYVLTSSYTYSGDLGTDLDKLSGSTGNLSTVAGLRNTYGADIVSMMVDTGSAYGTTGIGYLPGSPSGNQGAAFSVCSIRAVNNGHTMTHEVGHNMGCGHSKYQATQPGPGVFSYAAGWYFTGNNGVDYHTIMAYNADGYGNYYTACDYFSTPLITFQGVAVGDSTDGDNVRTISNMKTVVAAYRPTAVVTTNIVATPSFSPVSGTLFETSLPVTITCGTSGATVRYTTDTTEPTSLSTLYTGPITLTQSTTLKAKGFKSGMTESATATAVYYQAVPLAEALDAPGLSWSNVVGSVDWFGQTVTSYDGVDAAQSGSVGNSKSSAFQTTLTGPGSLSFRWKVSSESGYDFLKFSVDDVVQSGPISGETGWQQKTFSIAEGAHTVKWAYVKDPSNASGSDCGWVDQVAWMLTAPVLSVAPSARSLTKDAGSTTFSVTNAGPGTMAWTAAVTSGDSWARIVSGASGTNGGTVTIEVDANPLGGAERMATVRVSAEGASGSPAEMTVTQAANATFTVTFDAQGGSTPTPETKRVTYGAMYGDLATTSRGGYTFAGWWTGSGGTGTQVDAATVVSVSSDHTLFAKWVANVYTVTFDAQGGASPSPASKDVTFGSAYGALAATSRTGYTFAGWWTAANGAGTQVEAGSAVSVAGDHTLFAKWVANEYTVTFDAQEGKAPKPPTKIVTYQSAYGDLAITMRTGYTFEGWWTGVNGAGTRVNAATTVSIAADHTLYAKWDANVFTVTFDAQGGKAPYPGTKDVQYGNAYGALASTTRTGHTFGGWYTEANGGGSLVNADTTVSATADHALYACWTANPYKVTFDAQGGAVSPSSTTVTFGSTYGTLPVPTAPAAIRVGYTFGGWYTGAGGTGAQVAAETVETTASDHTLFARWVRNDYLSDPEADSELAAAGSYDGYFYRENVFTTGTVTAVRGTFTLKVTSLAGKMTAKAVMQKGSLSFSATAWSSVEDGTFRAQMMARNGERLDLYVRENRVWGTLEVAGETLTLDGARNDFSNAKDAVAQALLNKFKGYYTLALPLTEELSAGWVAAAPQGSGYLTLTVGSGGSAKVAGVLADGSAVSQSSRLIAFGGADEWACVPLFAPLYSKAGWVGGLLWINQNTGVVRTDSDLGWFVRWEKPGVGPDGFSELLVPQGCYYNPTPTLVSHYRFEAGPIGVSYFAEEAYLDLFWNSVYNGIGVTSSGTRMTMDKGTPPVKESDGEGGYRYDYGGANSAMATLSFTARTGVIKGSFKGYCDYFDGAGRFQHKTVSVPYAGVMVPAGRGATLMLGSGHCLVPDNDPEVKAFKIKRSFPVRLNAAE